MEVKVQKFIKEYFSYFDEFNNTAKSSLSECQNYAAAINKLIRCCNNIIQAQVSRSPLAKFEDLQGKLCASQHKKITNKIKLIESKKCCLENLSETLYYRSRDFRESVKEIDLAENSTLVKGSPTQPSLKQLLEYTNDTITFAGDVCAQIDSALKLLSYTKLETELFRDHFSYPDKWVKRISEIIQYTSFIS